VVVRWGVLRFGSGLPSPHFSLRVKMDKYLTRKKLATSETATSDKVTDTVDTPDIVDPAAHEEQSQNDSETGEEITSDDNPWPYISSFFKFQHLKGAEYDAPRRRVRRSRLLLFTL